MKKRKDLQNPGASEKLHLENDNKVSDEKRIIHGKDEIDFEEPMNPDEFYRT